MIEDDKKDELGIKKDPLKLPSIKRMISRADALRLLHDQKLAGEERRKRLPQANISDLIDKIKDSYPELTGMLNHAFDKNTSGSEFDVYLIREFERAYKEIYPNHPIDSRLKAFQDLVIHYNQKA